MKKFINSIQTGGIRTFCHMWVLKYFVLKVDKICKDVWTISSLDA